MKAKFLGNLRDGRVRACQQVRGAADAERVLVFERGETRVPEYSKEDKRRGLVRDVAFRNIHVTAPRQPSVSFAGYDGQHRVTGVTIEGFFLNGKDVTRSIRVDLGNFAERPACTTRSTSSIR